MLIFFDGLAMDIFFKKRVLKDNSMVFDPNKTKIEL